MADDEDGLDASKEELASIRRRQLDAIESIRAMQGAGLRAAELATPNARLTAPLTVTENLRQAVAAMNAAARPLAFPDQLLENVRRVGMPSMLSQSFLANLTQHVQPNPVFAGIAAGIAGLNESLKRPAALELSFATEIARSMRGLGSFEDSIRSGLSAVLAHNTMFWGRLPFARSLRNCRPTGASSRRL